jgi:hypothetical protein
MGLSCGDVGDSGSDICNCLCHEHPGIHSGDCCQECPICHEFILLTIGLNKHVVRCHPETLKKGKRSQPVSFLSGLEPEG